MSEVKKSQDAKADKSESVPLKRPQKAMKRVSERGDVHGFPVS